VDTSETSQRPNVESEGSVLISEMRARIELLEDQLAQANERDRENRRLLAAALERIPPQLEAPSEPREASETGTGEPQTVEEPRSESAEGRGFWFRLLGG
jgi:hypothetical protein